MLKSVTVGAYGWSPADWGEQFYPDDLPEDWRATYYANAFQSVLLPQAVWQAQCDDDALTEILEELPEGFKCVFELDTKNGIDIPDEQRLATYQTLCTQLPSCSSSKLKSDSNSNSKSQDQNAFHASEPEIIVAPTTPDSLLKQLQQRTRCHCLSADTLLSEPAGTDYRLAVLKAEEPLEPLAIKAVIEQLNVLLQDTGNDDDVYLFMDTPYQTLTQMQTMLELYGL